MDFRQLEFHEIEKFRELDRREVVTHIYYFRNGRLELEEEFHDVPLWTEKMQDGYIQTTENLAKRGGWVYGAFDGDLLVGMGTLDTIPSGRNEDLLNLAGLWVSKHYRGKGVASTLVDMIIKQAKNEEVAGLYVSATPSINTVGFYEGRGFVLADEVDKRLYEMEPEDIHFVLRF